MPDWDAVERRHVMGAIAEADRIGTQQFLSRYRFGRTYVATVWHGGQEYDAKALLGVAYLGATGRVATRDELWSSAGAAEVLQRLGFDVVVDPDVSESPPTRSRPAPRRTAAPRRAAGTRKVASSSAASGRTPAPEVEICPTCFMALPATGVCGICD